MITIKIGGASGVNLDAVCADIAELIKTGQQVLIVHGGSANGDEVCSHIYCAKQFVDG